MNFCTIRRLGIKLRGGVTPHVVTGSQGRCQTGSRPVCRLCANVCQHVCDGFCIEVAVLAWRCVRGRLAPHEQFCTETRCT